MALHLGMPACSRRWFLAAIAAGPLVQPVLAAKVDEQAFFKALAGRWQAKGSLKNANSELTELEQSWEGKFDGTGSFQIEGTRTINGKSDRFSWTYTHNQATDAYEAVLSGGDGANPLRFECSLADGSLEMTLKSITGSGSAAIELVDRITANGSVLTTEVRFTNEAGESTLTGSIRNERVKTP